MSNPNLHAISAEPLLEGAAQRLRRERPSKDVENLLKSLIAQGDVFDRSVVLYRTLRKHLLEEQSLNYLKGCMGSAARAEPHGIAALAALVAVRAPGDAVIETVREFSSLHRMAERFNHRLERGERLETDEQSLMDALSAVDDKLLDRLGSAGLDTGALPHPRDLGPAGACRRSFEAKVIKLQSRGVLDPEDIDIFVETARLELRARAQRASALAGSVNPYSGRHVSQVMPLLSVIDESVRDMGHFLDRLKEDYKSAHFREATPVLSSEMDETEQERLLEKVGDTEVTLSVRRIIHAIRRNPVPLRRLAYYVRQLYEIGECLVEGRVRKDPIDPVEATLIALEHADGDEMIVPAGEAVRAALVEPVNAERIPRLEIVGESLRVRFHSAAARRLALPHGLPLLPSAEEGLAEPTPEASVKDLVLDNINNTSILLGLLKNAKVVSTPGIVAMIVNRSRAMNVIDTICNQRRLHSGFANKDVPLALLRCPMRVPVKTLRRFISVRYVSKIDLRRMAVDRSAVRNEVADEIERYLKTLN